jgi:hypothetical protein
MNKASLINEIRRFVKDVSSDTSLQRWTDAILLERLNSCQEEMAAFTGMLESRVDINVSEGTAEYPFTSAIMAVKRAYWKDDNAVYVPLIKTTETELDLTDAEWRDVDGTPTHYYIRDNYIGLYPNPDVTRTAGLRVNIADRPTTLTSDTDIPFDEEYQWYFAHEGLAFGVARLCMFDEGKFTEAQVFEGKYFNVIKEIQKQVSSENIGTRIPNVYELSRVPSRRTR